MAAVAALGFGIFFWAASSSAQSAPPASASSQSFDELFQRGRLAAAGVTTLTARFTEITTSPLLTRPLVARGVMAVQRPSRVVLRYAEPEERVILIDGDRMTMVWPSRRLRQISNVASSQKRIQKYLADDSANELRSQFAVDLRARSERTGTFEVVLTPKRKQIRDTLVRLDLWVEQTSFLLSAIRMTFANGDSKTMEFQEVAPNAALDASTFIIDR